MFPVFRISGTAGRIALKFSVLLETFWAINERKQMCLKKDVRMDLHICRYPSLMVCVKRIVHGSSNTPNVCMMRPVHHEVRKGRHAHGHGHSIPLVTYMKCVASLSIGNHTPNFSAEHPVVYQIQKRVFARAHVQIAHALGLCRTHS